MQTKDQQNVVGLATRVAGFEVTCTSKLEFGHAATLQEFYWDNHCGLKKTIHWWCTIRRVSCWSNNSCRICCPEPHINTMNVYMYTPFTSHTPHPSHLTHHTSTHAESTIHSPHTHPSPHHEHTQLTFHTTHLWWDFCVILPRCVRSLLAALCALCALWKV